jgi:hypothetical protein
LVWKFFWQFSYNRVYRNNVIYLFLF